MMPLAQDDNSVQSHWCVVVYFPRLRVQSQVHSDPTVPRDSSFANDRLSTMDLSTQSIQYVGSLLLFKDYPAKATHQKDGQN